MRIFLAFLVLLFAAGCGTVDNPIQGGSTGASSRIPLESDEPDSAADTTQLITTGFDNPLSSFDFNTIDGDRDIEPDSILDPVDNDPVTPSDDADASDDIEPDAVEHDDSDEDDDIEPDAVRDDDSDDGSDDVPVDDVDSDDFGPADEVIE